MSKEKLLFSRIVVMKMRENSKRIRGMERKNKDVNNPLIITRCNNSSKRGWS
jgi:hypothetical protein